MSTLQFRYAVVDGAATVRPIVNDEDLLASHGHWRGPDPDRLLPPLSSGLLPTRAGRMTTLGVCSCGEVGCGRLSITVRRDGADVLWEPALPAAGMVVGATLDRDVRIPLSEYLEAVDQAADERPGEGQGRRVARQVRMRLDRHDDVYGDRPLDFGRCDWVSAWPWDSDAVQVSVSGPAGQRVHEFLPAAGEHDDTYTDRIADALPELVYAQRRT